MNNAIRQEIIKQATELEETVHNIQFGYMSEDVKNTMLIQVVGRLCNLFVTVACSDIDIDETM